MGLATSVCAITEPDSVVWRPADDSGTRLAT